MKHSQFTATTGRKQMGNQIGVYYGHRKNEALFYKDSTITKSEIRVYCLLKCLMNNKNEINCTQADLANELHMNTTDVNRAITSLIKRGMLNKIINLNDHFTYRISTDYARKELNQS